MNQRLRKYLDDFEDFELAFFASYMLSTYMESTWKAIARYIYEERGLTQDKIVCNICGYWITDPNREKPRSNAMLSRIKDFFLDHIFKRRK